MAGVTYVRGSGGHVAERVRPAEGSPEAAELAALAADPAAGWRAIPDPEPEPETESDQAPETEQKAPADSTEEPPPLERPNKSASKADWVAYAVAQGVDQAEAEASTRDALAERFTEKEAS